LVTTGSEGLAGTLYSEEIYLKSHKSQYIDYLTFHLWPKNWSWFDPEDAEKTYPVTVTKAVDYINQHIGFARRLNKPLILEEFGIPRDKGLFQDSVPTSVRDKYYKKIFELVFDSASAGSPLAGYNFWAWGGEARAQHPDGWWKPGDAFVGDPSGEPQGYNSIFNTDKSTLLIIKESSEKLKNLTEKPLGMSDSALKP
ncbi:MAG: mannanase, partial [Methanococcaceae archaeon]